MPKAERAKVFMNIANEIDKVSDRMARVDCLNTGIPLTTTRGICQWLRQPFEDAARDIDEGMPQTKIIMTLDGKELHSKPRPRGICLILVPWNVPAGTALSKLIAALVCGCPVLIKPSEFAPFSIQLLVDACLKGGLPKGMLQLLHGGAELGSRLCRHPAIAVVMFAGSEPGAKSVSKLCGERGANYILERGGVNPLIVCADADFEEAVKAAVTGLTLLNGQWCAGIGRIFVHKSIAEKFEQEVVSALGKVKFGHAFNPDTEVGPLSNKKYLKYMLDTYQEVLETYCESIALTTPPDLDLLVPLVREPATAPKPPKSNPRRSSHETNGHAHTHTPDANGSAPAAPAASASPLEPLSPRAEEMGLWDDERMKTLQLGKQAMVFPAALFKGAPLEATHREVFGCIAALHVFEEIEEVIRDANESNCILQAYVFSKSDKTCERIADGLCTGLCQFNFVAPGFPAVKQPVFSYYGKAGYGTDGSIEALLPVFCTYQARGPVHQHRRLMGF